MIETRRQLLATMGLGVATLALPRGARAQKKYDPGASDSEIKIGNTMPYSGPLSSAGSVFGGCSTAFFKMINAEGGINGHRINFISYDDAYSPPKTVEQTRKLVESDRVLFIFAGAGTPTQSAVLKYMNKKKYRSYSSFRVPTSLPTLSISRGRCRSLQTTRALAGSTPATSSPIILEPRSACFIRTTI
jgi:ABC-type branched-subunit amino acid transport system substrate-binding protein